jgi:hypothetical protein
MPRAQLEDIVVGFDFAATVFLLFYVDVCK